MADLSGKKLGRYDIQERVGQGGMAEVYRAYHASLDRVVAIKVLQPFVLEDSRGLERFRREARAVAALHHPNIIQVYDFDTVDDVSFMVMEFIDGSDLAAVQEDSWSRGENVSYERIGEIISGIGSALGYAHSRGMIHRDIKPQNIMFTSSGHPLLTDFGIIRILGTKSIYGTSTITGTPYYMSPEQGRGAQLDSRSDIYSLGVVLYELATGKVPYEGDSAVSVIVKHLTEPLTPPHNLNPDTPPKLEAAILKALAKAPEDRFQNAAEMVEAVQEALVGVGQSIKSPEAAPIIIATTDAPPPAPEIAEPEPEATVVEAAPVVAEPQVTEPVPELVAEPEPEPEAVAELEAPIAVAEPEPRAIVAPPELPVVETAPPVAEVEPPIIAPEVVAPPARPDMAGTRQLSNRTQLIAPDEDDAGPEAPAPNRLDLRTVAIAPDEPAAPEIAAIVTPEPAPPMTPVAPEQQVKPDLGHTNMMPQSPQGPPLFVPPLAAPPPADRMRATGHLASRPVPATPPAPVVPVEPPLSAKVQPAPPVAKPTPPAPPAVQQLAPPAPTPARRTTPPLQDTISGQMDEDSLTIRLAVPEIIVESGGAPVENVATLTNPSQELSSDQYTLDLLDLEPEWFKLSVKSVLLMSGDSAQSRITFTVPRRGAEPGVYMYRLVARSRANPRLVGVTYGRLRVSSPPTLQLSVNPTTQTGLTGHYTVSLINGPASPLVVQMDGVDPSDTLSFVSTPPRLRMDPGAEGVIEVEVGVKPDAVGEPRAYPFTLMARLTGDEATGPPIECAAELIYVPLVEIDMRVETESTRGDLADYMVVLTNPTALPLEVELTAEEAGDALDIYFHGESEHLRLARGESVTLKMLVRLSQRPLPEAATVYPFTVRAQISNTAGAGAGVQEVVAEFQFDPLAAGSIVSVSTAPKTDPLAGLEMALAPQRTESVPAHFSVRLRNGGSRELALALSPVDSAGAFSFALEPAELALSPGVEAEVPLTVQLRRTTGSLPPAGSYRFDVVCTDRSDPSGVRSAAGEIVLPQRSPGGLRAILTDAAPRGMVGQYDVRLINDGVEAVGIILRGRDPSGLLQFSFSTLRMVLEPDADKTVRVTVRPNALEPLSEEHLYPFEVVCWVPGTDILRVVRGQLQYVSF